MSRGPDAATLLERALVAHALAAGCAVEVTAIDSARWASATFVGARHLVALTVTSAPALYDWLSGLPEADLVLRGHLVADLVVEHILREDQMVTLALEILTVEER